MSNEMFNMVKAVVGVGVLSLPAGEYTRMDCARVVVECRASCYAPLMQLMGHPSTTSDQPTTYTNQETHHLPMRNERTSDYTKAYNAEMRPSSLVFCK